MSIWHSLTMPDITGLDLADELTGQGEPAVAVDVATTHHHRLVRLTLTSIPGATLVDADVLLSADQCRQLAHALTSAATATEYEDAGRFA